MAISSAGVGSGLDVQSLVAQLVASERAPADTRLNKQESTTRSTLSAIGSLKSALADLQTAANALTGLSSVFGKLAVSSSTPTLFTATTSTGAAAGSFDVEVLTLAKTSKLASDAYASAGAVVGNGTVTIGVGADSFSVTLDSSGNTLADLRDKINNATDNTGVTATLLNESGGTRLILTSRETGTSHEVTLSSADDVGGASFVNTSVVQASQDAQIKIDGFSYTSASNTVSDAISGVTVKLLKAEPGTVGSLDLSNDAAASSQAVQDLVKAYNAVMDVMAKYGSYDAGAKTGGPLMGDAAVRSAMGQVRAIFGGTAAGAGAYTVLSQLGITTQSDGKLKLDTAKLDNALATDATSVKNLFGGTNGFANKLDSFLDGALGTSGRIAADSKGLQARLDAIGDQRDRLDLRMSMVEARYRKQFTALDSLMGQMQATSSYLTQQLATLPGAGS